MPAQRRCFITSVCKIRFLKTTFCGLIDKHVSLDFVRQQLRERYSETGRPSIDPELLLRMLLIGYL